MPKPLETDGLAPPAQAVAAAETKANARLACPLWPTKHQPTSAAKPQQVRC